MKVVGVTGTDGKTTTSCLIYHILRQSGVEVSLITSIGAYIGNKKYNTGLHVTTPSSWNLQRYIKQAKKEGSSVFVLEVTSHALDQNRVSGIAFDIAVVTNITREHLDYHKTYSKYLESKMKLLKKSKKIIANMDDQSFSTIKNVIKDNNLITYSTKNDEADITRRKYSFKTQLEGNFNIQNILAAIGVAKELGLDEKRITDAIGSFKPPEGRQEIMYDKEFRVVVDFAHTPNSFEALLSEMKKKSRLIHVFGSAGERDKQKRPTMGAISSRYTDVIVLSSEDPRSEDVESINSDIKKGISAKFKKIHKGDYKEESHVYIEIVNRREAIEFAIKIAKKGDTVIITGKGHEKSMNYGNGEESWSDVDEVKNALRKYSFV